MTDFIPFKESKKKKARWKKKEERKDNGCEFKILVSCGRQRPFFACYYELYEKVRDKVARMYCKEYPNCSQCEEDSFNIADETGVLYPDCIYDRWIDEVTTATIDKSEDEDLLRACGLKSRGLVWREGKVIRSNCSCKPTRITDEEIVEREALTEMGEYEPCQFRCNQLQQNGMCSFMEKKKQEEKTAQRDLVRYLPRKRTRPD